MAPICNRIQHSNSRPGLTPSPQRLRINLAGFPCPSPRLPDFPEVSPMLAYLVLLLAVLSSVLPHAFHAASWNFTAVGGGLLFFGSQMNASRNASTWRAAAKIASAVAVLIATDYYLTVYTYHYPFHAGSYLVTWAWYAAICLLGMGLLQKTTTLRVVVGVLASATSFFLLSNFAVWIGGTMYPHTLAG